MDDSTITCDEIVDVEAKSNDQETKAFPTNFNEKHLSYKTQNFYILLTFSLITIVSLITVTIYCYLVKYLAKQKHLLAFDSTNNELKEPIY